MFNKRKPEPPKPELPLPELRMPLPELDPLPELPPAPPPPPPPMLLSAPEPIPEPEPVAADDGLDMPAFHEEEIPAPAPLPPVTETPMARSPFAPALPPLPSSGVRAAAAQEPARRTLVVGRGISVQGVVQDAERLVVEGTVEATMINGLVELAIAPGGIFKGEVEVDEAEVAGTIDGTLTARNALIVRGTGRVLGTARCRRLQVEDGGQITGRIEMLTEPAPVSYPE